MLELSKIITREQLCEQLGISANTLRRWIKERDFPHPLNASGRRPFFDSRRCFCVASINGGLQ